MRLYHYSNKFFSQLKNRIMSGQSSESEIEEQLKWAKKVNAVGVYSAHISFFFDQLPLVLLGKIFGRPHHTWFNGNKLYEYVIDTYSLDDNITYEVVETPLTVKILDQTEWVDTEDFLIQYKKKLNALKTRVGELGKSKINLESEIRKYQNLTKDFYVAAKKRDDFNENFDKYAASVPHVMLYPDSGTIDIKLVNQVIVGSETRVKVNSRSKTFNT